jgi:hypothetical protein
VRQSLFQHTPYCTISFHPLALLMFENSFSLIRQ